MSKQAGFSDWTPEEHLSYAAIHAETDLALFAVSHLKLLWELAGWMWDPKDDRILGGFASLAPDTVRRLRSSYRERQREKS